MEAESIMLLLAMGFKDMELDRIQALSITLLILGGKIVTQLKSYSMVPCLALLPILD